MFISLLFAVAASSQVPGMAPEEWSCSTAHNKSVFLTSPPNSVYTIADQKLLLGETTSDGQRRPYKIISNSKAKLIAIYYYDQDVKDEDDSSEDPAYYLIFSMIKRNGHYTLVSRNVGEGALGVDVYGRCKRKQ